MTNRILLIYNPRAGKGLFLQSLSSVIDLFTKAGFSVEVYPTQASGDAVKKIMSLKEEYNMIVPAGGDGTLDEVVTGVIRAGLKTPLGYIPVGSTNDYAASLGLSTNVLEAAGDIISGQVHGLDAGIVNGENVFIYVAAFGAFTDVAYQTNQDMKNALGHVAYLIEATKRIGGLKPYLMQVRTAETSLTQEYIFGMITNSTSVGGIRNITGREVKLDDGLFEVTLVHNPRNILEMQEVVSALLTGHHNTRLIDFFRTDKIEMTSSEQIPWTFDGEFGGIYQMVHIENHRQSIRLVYDSSPAK